MRLSNIATVLEKLRALANEHGFDISITASDIKRDFIVKFYDPNNDCIGHIFIGYETDFDAIHPEDLAMECFNNMLRDIEEANSYEKT